MSFPDYESDSSALVKMYLTGEIDSNPSDVNTYAASGFYAVDRYASYKKDWGKFYENGGIIIADGGKRRPIENIQGKIVSLIEEVTYGTN